MKKYIVLVEALISVGLIGYFSFSFLLMIFFGGVVAFFSPRPFEVLYVLAVLSIVYTLVQYAVLATYTALNKKFNFGVLFWLGIPGVLVSVHLLLLSQASIGKYEILIASPIIFSLIHFICFQIRGFNLKV